MHKGVLVYLVILVVMVVAALFLSGVLGNKSATSTTTVQVGTTATTTVAPSNNSTPKSTSTTVTSTTVKISQCQSRNATESIPNGDFSTGTFEDWNSSEIQGISSGFGDAPLNITYANENGGYYAYPWTGYDGTYFATTYQGGLHVQPGNLTSAPFEVKELYLNFKIISPQNSQLYVEVLQNGTPKVITYYNTFAAHGVNNSLSQFVNASIPLVTLLCANVSIRVHAGVVSTGMNQYNYIAVGDFYEASLPVSTPGIVVNQTIS